MYFVCAPQRMCRRLLALYDLPSWGRCELMLSLLQEPGVTYSLEDVVQAVKESHDKDFIRRLLNNECPVCLCIFPRSKVTLPTAERKEASKVCRAHRGRPPLFCFVSRCSR